MDLLQEYSSGASDSSSPEEDEEEVIGKQPRLQVPDPSTQPPLSVPELIIYLQNYSDTQMNRKSIFLYVPWKPTRDAVSKLNAATSKVLAAKNILLAEYKWTPIHQQRSNLGYHITLHPNIYGEEYKMKVLLDNIRNALITDVKYPKNSIGYDEERLERNNRLSKLLGKSKDDGPDQKSINLRFQPKLRVFQSPNSNKLFLSGLIEYSDEVQQFFTLVNEVIENSVDSLQLEKSPFYSLDHHHITFSTGSPNTVGQQYEELDALNQELESVDVGDIIGDVNVSISEIVMSQLGQSQQVDSFPFDI